MFDEQNVIGRINYGYRVVALLTDGSLWETKGDCYSRRGSLQPGTDPKAFYEKAVQSYKDSPWRPYYFALENLDSELGDKALLDTAIRILPSDPDAIVCELEDAYDLSFDLDDVEMLCSVYRACQAHAREKRGI